MRIAKIEHAYRLLAVHACPWGDGTHAAERHFYLHDRLGSVRLIIDAAGEFDNMYGGDILSTATVTELVSQFYE